MSDDRKGLPGLRAARESRGWSQSALARAVEVPDRQIQRWESGESSPSVWAALDLARSLGVSVEDLAALAPAEATP